MRPWENEPDKLDFEASGLTCALRRGPGGHWCGYVAIPEGHPWHGKGYDDTVKVPQSIIDRPVDVDKVGVINLFCAAGSADAMADGWVPIVLAVDAHGGLTYASDHEPCGKPDGRWWFGFDCAHSGDFCPKFEELSARPDDVYRDMDYVKAECESLARQLSAFAAATEPQP